MADKTQTVNQTWERLTRLRNRIDNAKGEPKPADLAELRAVLATEPDLRRVLGDMERQAEYTLISLSRVPESSHKAMSIGQEALRRDLGYAEAPHLERMLIDQVALSWLRLSIVELENASRSSQNIGIPQADYWERALSAAQRRYLRAVETLARVRRLLRPGAIQVNIGAQQVNVLDSGTNGTGEPV